MHGTFGGLIGRANTFYILIIAKVRENIRNLVAVVSKEWHHPKG